ncbi:MAG: glycosyl hydrolase family 18 protein [Clostridia bacterium]
MKTKLLRKHLFLAAGIVLLIVFISWLFLHRYDFIQVQATRGNLVFDGHLIGRKEFLSQDNKVYLAISDVKELLGGEWFFDADEQELIYTSPTIVLRLQAASKKVLLNQQGQFVQFPLIVQDEKAYLEVAYLTTIYPLGYEYYPQTDTLALYQAGKEYQQSTIAENTIIRSKAEADSGYVEKLTITTDAIFLQPVGAWQEVLMSTGQLGFVPKTAVTSPLAISWQNKQNLPVVTEFISPIKPPLNLTWDYVNKQTPRLEKLTTAPGVNVIAPTWFALADLDGSITSKAEKYYLEWAKTQKLAVWPSVTNAFSPKLTNALLESSKNRAAFIENLLSLAKEYQLQGLNIDFENIYQADKTLLTQLVRELVPLAHKQGITISMDVTGYSTSPTWSLCYDRKALGERVDFLIYMAYDQHTASGEEVGSVAEVSWVKENIAQMLEEVAAEKLILAMPLYQRLWFTDLQGKITVRSIGMNTAATWIAENKPKISYDQQAGQNYVELQTTTGAFQMWIEDTQSLENRINLAAANSLGGIATWRKGFEKPGIWQFIAEKLLHFPTKD